MKVDEIRSRIAKLFSLNARAEEVRRHVPLHQRPEIELITRGLPQGGPHLYNKKGAGLEYFDQRPFVSGQDDPRGIHSKYSQKRDALVFVEKEAEIRHNYYFWRSNLPSMDWKSDKAPYTPREAAEILMMAMAKQVSRTHEKVALLESGETRRGHQAGEWLGMQLALDRSTHDMPRMKVLPARQSTAILVSDFLPPDHHESSAEKIYGDFNRTLGQLRSQSVSGWIVMVADPQTVDFDYKDRELFKGLSDNSLEINLGKGKRGDQRREYQEILRQHIDRLRQISEGYGFKMIVQRTDEPLQQALRAIYRLGPSIPQSISKLGLKA